MLIKVFGRDQNQRQEIPDGVQSNGRVSYEQGFGGDYSLELTKDGNAKNVERGVINQLMFELTTVLSEIQRQGCCTWNNQIEYSKGATVYYNGATYLSLVWGNRAVPVHGGAWKDLSVEQEIPEPPITLPAANTPPLRLSKERYLSWNGIQNGGNGTVLVGLDEYHSSRTKQTYCRSLEMFINGTWVTVPYTA